MNKTLLLLLIAFISHPSQSMASVLKYSSKKVTKSSFTQATTQQTNQCASQQQAFQKSFNDALIQLNSGDPSIAYTLFESIPPSSPLFLAALNEIQKLNYKTEMWERFFAYALFYRTKVLTTIKNDKTSLSNSFFVRMLSLEASALMRHCMYKEAKAVSELGLEIAKQINSNDTQSLQKALSLAELLGNSQKIMKDPEHARFSPSLFSGKFYWPLSHDSLRLVKHPKILRLQIKDRCSK